MYSFRKVHKRYGLRTVALQKIDLDLAAGDFFVLYGPAGAGKSSMLNLLAGITRPTSGDILRSGESILHLPPEHRGAAMAFENYALYSHLSVGENLSFPLLAKGVHKSEANERVAKIARTLGIDHLLDRRPGHLSGGQRQRVALGRAIIRPADIYLLDEPIGHLDAKLRHRMRAELKALAQELNATVVFTTTSSREALALADRMAVINEGRLEQVGTPQELYKHPQNTFVASFVGDPPMSFFSVRAESQNGKVTLLGHDDIQLGDIQLGALDKESTFGKELKMGVRANAIELTERGRSGSVPGSVKVVEHLGYAKIAVIDVGEDQVSVLINAADSIKPGEALGLRIRERAWQLFSQERAVATGGSHGAH